jgi:hypothetical protein
MPEHRGLTGIDVASGVNIEGEPFCHVTATSEDGLELLGQLDPFEVRRMALGWLEAAEAAVHDAAVFRELVSALGVAPSTAAGFVEALRKHRGDSTTSKRRPEDI